MLRASVFCFHQKKIVLNASRFFAAFLVWESSLIIIHSKFEWGFCHDCIWPIVWAKNLGHQPLNGLQKKSFVLTDFISQLKRPYERSKVRSLIFCYLDLWNIDWTMNLCVDRNVCRFGSWDVKFQCLQFHGLLFFLNKWYFLRFPLTSSWFFSRNFLTSQEPNSQTFLSTVQFSITVSKKLWARFCSQEVPFTFYTQKQARDVRERTFNNL